MALKICLMLRVQVHEEALAAAQKLAAAHGLEAELREAAKQLKEAKLEVHQGLLSHLLAIKIQKCMASCLCRTWRPVFTRLCSKTHSFAIGSPRSLTRAIVAQCLIFVAHWKLMLLVVNTMEILG